MLLELVFLQLSHHPFDAIPELLGHKRRWFVWTAPSAQIGEFIEAHSKNSVAGLAWEKNLSHKFL